MRIRKQYARREIAGFESPYVDPFSYRTLAELGKEPFVAAFERVCVESQGRDVLAYLTQPQREFDWLIDFAGAEFVPENWLLAFSDRALVGMVLPQRFHDLQEEGTLFHIGVVPEFRARGYGKVVHAKGLAVLAGLGVERYVGSTDVDNLAMIGVFEANGCRLTAIHERDIPGPT